MGMNEKIEALKPELEKFLALLNDDEGKGCISYWIMLGLKRDRLLEMLDEL